MSVPSELARGVLAGERRQLSKAITLIESTKVADRKAAEALMAALLPKTGNAARIGISGAPGAGKSSFIEAFGLQLIGEGHKVAVLAVDPTSAVSGGSILGDKTRMEELARSDASFIRPSPSGRQLGGVARRTREAMLACEAAGFDVVIVETVGVGQSEAAVADMVDSFVLLIAAGAGDELQGLKRGAIELADIVLVTKADGALMDQAQRTCADYRSALRLMPRRLGSWRARVELCSALKRTGIAEAWALIQQHRQGLEASGALEAKRAAQARAWMWSEVKATLLSELEQSAGIAELAERLEAKVEAGTLAPGAAAREILSAFAKRRGAG